MLRKGLRKVRKNGLSEDGLDETHSVIGRDVVHYVYASR